VCKFFDRVWYRALHNAVKMQTSIEEIDRLAAAAAAAGKLDAMNIRRQTALHLAVIVNWPYCVSRLISLGASLRHQEQLHGDNVLHLVCRLGHGRCLGAVFDACTKRSPELDIKRSIKTFMHSFNYEGSIWFLSSLF